MVYRQNRDNHARSLILINNYTIGRSPIKVMRIMQFSTLGLRPTFIWINRIGREISDFY